MTLSQCNPNQSLLRMEANWTENHFMKNLHDKLLQQSLHFHFETSNQNTASSTWDLVWIENFPRCCQTYNTKHTDIKKEKLKNPNVVVQQNQPRVTCLHNTEKCWIFDVPPTSRNKAIKTEGEQIYGSVMYQDFSFQNTQNQNTFSNLVLLLPRVLTLICHLVQHCTYKL